MNFSDFSAGARCAFSGLGLLAHRRLRAFVVVPLLINTLLFGLGLWWAVVSFDNLIAWLTDQIPGWLGWLVWLLWPLFALTALLLVFFTFTFVANIIGAPFNGLLAERAEAVLTGKLTGSSNLSLWREIISAPVEELRKLVYFLLLVVPVLLLFLVPVVQALVPLVWIGLGAWVLALEYLDYPLGNRGIRFRDQRRLLAAHRWRMLGFGAGTLAMTLVPGLNFVAMPAAVIGATALCVRDLPQQPRGSA